MVSDADMVMIRTEIPIEHAVITLFRRYQLDDNYVVQVEREDYAQHISENGIAIDTPYGQNAIATYHRCVDAVLHGQRILS